MTHHAQAIHMTRMAAAHGANPHVLKLANKIDQSQVPEIHLMQQWLGRYNQYAPDTSSWHTMQMPGMLTAAQLQELDAAQGVAFDRAFLNLMIQHHNGALKMVDDLFAVPLAGQEVDVSVFANDVVAVQTAEIGIMRQLLSQLPANEQGTLGEAPKAIPDITLLVSRLNLEAYKATVKGLTQFGDRVQGTDRNRAALEWIEKTLRASGCTNTERPSTTTTTAARGRSRRAGRATGGGRSNQAPGGGRIFGNRASTAANLDSLAQPDERLRKLNSQPTTAGPREDVYCTKIGSTHPEEMYIVGAHMDGRGWGEAANDDGSGTALVMELARIFSNPDVKTERSIRFILWNNEETGLDGAKAYVAQRASLQGIESPPRSGKYPEPRWLGMVQHDMMMFNHGMPRADGTVSNEQSAEAAVTIEFQAASKFADQSDKLAWKFDTANELYATDYPAQVGQHMTNTDSQPFQDLVPTISLREMIRGAQMGAGWDPTHHQPTDTYSHFSDKDFALGLAAAQTTLSAIATLAAATIAK